MKTVWDKFKILFNEENRKESLQHFRGIIFWGMSVEIFIDIVWSENVKNIYSCQVTLYEMCAVTMNWMNQECPDK